jgi:hypothetical protein
MNERIEALKKLATKEVWSENQYNGSPEFDGYELDADMFAKLIVAEVNTVLEKRFMGDLNREDMEVRRCIADVKNHFGDKE